LNHCFSSHKKQSSRPKSVKQSEAEIACLIFSPDSSHFDRAAECFASDSLFKRLLAFKNLELSLQFENRITPNSFFDVFYVMS
jgi:hypothetical protein